MSESCKTIEWGVDLLGTITKKLIEMSGLKAGQGALFLQTYREAFHITVSEDEVIVQLRKAIFPGGTPDEITVTVEWNDESGPLPS